MFCWWTLDAPDRDLVSAIAPSQRAGFVHPPARRGRGNLPASHNVCVAGRWVSMAVLMLVAGAGVSLAQTSSVDPRVASRASKAPCVMVDVAGQKAGDLDCANQALSSAVHRAQAASQPNLDVPTIGSSPSALGEANVAATRERLGSAFGVSVNPQRPDATYAPPLGRPAR